MEVIVSGLLPSSLDMTRRVFGFVLLYNLTTQHTLVTAASDDAAKHLATAFTFQASQLDELSRLSIPGCSRLNCNRANVSCSSSIQLTALSPIETVSLEAKKSC